jgi:hypothetical protein
MVYKAVFEQLTCMKTYIEEHPGIMKYAMSIAIVH